MKNLFVTSILAIGILSSCSEDKLCLRGLGDVNTYELDFNTFDRIALLGPVNLTITQGTTQSVIVRAESEMMKDLDYSVINRKLRIGYEENISCFDTDYGVWVDVTVPSIEAVSVSGTSQVKSIGELNLDEINIHSTGTANVSLSGSATKQVLDGEGVLNASNFNLVTENTHIFIEGSGNFEVNCASKLNIDVEGSAVVKYKGHPTITKEVSGSLDLVDMN